MPLARFVRDERYFQDLRDNSEVMRAGDFDDQFNEVVDYINNNMVPVINGIIAGVGQGVVGQPNTFLRNIGDGNTEWAAVNSDAIPDFVLEFSKLAQAAATCTILATGNDRIFTEVTTNTDNQVLTSVAGDAPVWSDVLTANIADRTITGNKIGLGVLVNEHLQPGTLVNNLPNGRIVGNNFTDQAITNPKIARGSIEVRNLGIIPLDGLDPNVWNNRLTLSKLYKLGTISPAKIKDAGIIPNHFNKSKFVIAGKIAPGTFIDGYLKSLNTSPTRPTDIQGTLPSNILTPNFKMTGRELTINAWVKAYFEPTAEAAFTAKGCGSG